MMYNDSYYNSIQANILKWGRRARHYEKRRFNYFRLIQKQVLNLIDFRPDTYFLDIGCAIGWAVEYAAARIKGKGRSMGIDLCPQMIAKAKSLSLYHNTCYQTADAHNLPFKANSFDYILCTNSFHHYLYPDRVVNEIHRVLKKRGRFYLLDSCTDSMIVRHINRWLKQKEQAHVSFYSTIEMTGLFKKAKLKYLRNKQMFTFLKLHVGEKQ